MKATDAAMCILEELLRRLPFGTVQLTITADQDFSGMSFCFSWTAVIDAGKAEAFFLASSMFLEQLTYPKASAEDLAARWILQHKDMIS